MLDYDKTIGYQNWQLQGPRRRCNWSPSASVFILSILRLRNVYRYCFRLLHTLPVAKSISNFFPQLRHQMVRNIFLQKSFQICLYIWQFVKIIRVTQCVEFWYAHYFFHGIFFSLHGIRPSCMEIVCRTLLYENGLIKKTFLILLCWYMQQTTKSPHTYTLLIIA